MEHEQDTREHTKRLKRGQDTRHKNHLSQYSYVFLYLSAIVAANLTVVWFGPGVTVINAFLFIGLDLTSRDKLHDAWKGDRLVLKMVLLIGAGSALSYVLNRDVGQIAVASFVAFCLAAITDTVCFHLLRDKRYLLRVNGSNVPSALVDSLVFPTLAFGGFLPMIVLGQFLAKVCGGFIWSVIFKQRGNVRY